MSTPDDKLARLRSEAESVARARPAQPLGVSELLDVAVMQKTLHELQVYQIELEMQNDELRSTQVLLDSERSRYKDLYDLAPVGYITLSSAGEIMHTNLKAASLLGLPRSQLFHQPMRRFVTKPQRDAHYLFTQQVLHTRQPDQYDVHLVNAAGLEFWAQMTLTPQGDGDELHSLLVVITDISDRKQAEEKLYESEEIHRSLFNSIDEGFCIIEMVLDKTKKPIDYRFVAVNPSFEKQSGLVNAQGRLASDLMPGLEHYWIEAYAQVLLTGEPMCITRYAAALGRWFDCYAFRTGPKDQSWIGVVFNDISERKQTEADRQFLDQVLLHKNAELQDAQALAEKANLAKSEFLSGMSHELRTPLTAILGFAQLMDASTPAPTPGQKRSLDQILKAGWYLLELINEILDLAVIESGKLKLVMQSVPISSLLVECEAIVEMDADRRSIHLYFEKPSAMVYVHADRTRLKQALINLLSNAIKYNREGGSVRLTFNADDPQHLRICIEDTGAGLTAAQIAQLFQPFNRLGQESRAEPGTGIGLVMTKQLVELMGGSIGLNSTVGKGSVFWIEVKYANEHTDDHTRNSPKVDIHVDALSPDQTGMHAQVAVQAASSAGFNVDAHAQSNGLHKAGSWDMLRANVDAGHAHNFRRNLAGLYTLLYVEDNPANLLLMQELLARRPDVRLLNAHDGMSGLALARNAMPDVILLDTNLPGLSGMDVLRILVNDPLTAAIPVLILSANAMPGEIQAGLDAGCYRYLTKPIHVKELMHNINVALKLEPAQFEPGQLSQLGELT